MMLRIREINGVPKEVTLKVKVRGGDKEITRIIDEDVDYNKSLFEQKLLNEEMLERLLEVGIKPQELEIITSLTTDRIEVEENNFLFVIDINFYSRFERAIVKDFGAWLCQISTNRSAKCLDNDWARIFEKNIAHQQV